MTSSSDNRRWLVPVAFFCVYFFWGSTFVAIRYAVAYLNPAFVSGFRYLIAGCVLLAIAKLRGAKVGVSRRELLRAFVLGVVLLTGNNVLLGWAEQYVTAGYAALLTASVPMLIALVETFVPGGLPLNRIGWLGTALGIGGLFLLLWPVLRRGLVLRTSATGAEHALLLGTFILIFGILCWVVGSLLSARWSTELSPLLASSWQMVLGGALNTCIGTALGGWRTAHWTHGLVLAMVWLTVFGSFVCYSAYTYLLHTVSVAKVATYAYVNPVVAVLLSALFLHEGLHGSQWIAMGVILAAVAIVTASKAAATPVQQQELEPAE